MEPDMPTMAEWLEVVGRFPYLKWVETGFQKLGATRFEEGIGALVEVGEVRRCPSCSQWCEYSEFAEGSESCRDCEDA